MSTERRVGTVSRGIRLPIIRQGDDLAAITADSVLKAAESEGFGIRDRDVIAITESVVARSQGNYATVDDIAADVRAKFGGGTVGVISPIAICLRGIAKGASKIVLMLSYPSDEVGNELVSLDKIDAAGVNPYSDVLTLERYRELFGVNKHEFTGVDYVEYYSNLIRESGADVEIIFANQPRTILKYTDCVLTCDIHTRERTKRILKASGGRIVLGLDDILNAPVNGSGFNEKYGLLGSNKSTEDKVKLFPRAAQGLVEDIQKRMFEATGNEDCYYVKNARTGKYLQDYEKTGDEIMFQKSEIFELYEEIKLMTNNPDRDIDVYKNLNKEVLDKINNLGKDYYEEFKEIVAECLFNVGKYEDAIKIYEEKKEYEKIAKIYYENIKDYNKAFEYFDKYNNIDFACKALSKLDKLDKLFNYANKNSENLGLIEYNNLYKLYSNEYFLKIIKKQNKNRLISTIQFPPLKFININDDEKKNSDIFIPESYEHIDTYYKTIYNFFNNYCEQTKIILK